LNKITNLDKLCIHTITTKPWSLEEAVDNYSEAGVAGITVWRDALEGRNVSAAGERIRKNGLEIVSVARGGFFPGPDSKSRQKAIEENLQAVDECAALGAPLLVLVCGAVPGQSLKISIQQIQDGIEAVLPHAEACGVKLGIEPLHPMYADSRSAISNMKAANDMCDAVNSQFLGVTVDVYHLWWDLELEQEIKRCGEAGRIFSFHICDWKTPLEDILNDRGLMGEGIIDIPRIRSWVESAGFDGFHEVEIFSNRWWQADQHEFLNKIKENYLQFS